VNILGGFSTLLQGKDRKCKRSGLRQSLILVKALQDRIKMGKYVHISEITN
jgi:hypothetical protein